MPDSVSAVFTTRVGLRLIIHMSKGLCRGAGERCFKVGGASYLTGHGGRAEGRGRGPSGDSSSSLARACRALAKPLNLDSRSVPWWDIPSSCRLSAATCALRRQSMISEPPLLVSSSEKQVRPGRLQFGAVRTAYANLQFVCSVDHALWADPWCTMSPGPGRRAARRSEMQIMFAVREGSRSL